MNKDVCFMELRQVGVLAIIRIRVAKDLLRIAHALHEGGVKCLLELSCPRQEHCGRLKKHPARSTVYSWGGTDAQDQIGSRPK